MLNTLEKTLPAPFMEAIESFEGHAFSILRPENTTSEQLLREIAATKAELLRLYGPENGVAEYLESVASTGGLESANFLQALWARLVLLKMDFSNFIEPRMEQWKKFASLLELRYVKRLDATEWNWLEDHIPSISLEKVQRMIEKIHTSSDFIKLERMQLVFLSLLAQSSGTNGEQTYSQLQEKINEVEVVFVPWRIVLENQIRNSRDSITDPLELAEQFRSDSTSLAIKDAMAGVAPANRDQFYRGIMKPPSPTACRANIFPGKIVYGLTGHVAVIDQANGAMAIHRTPKSETLSWWFDLEFYRSLPESSYEFKRAGCDGNYVWDNYSFNEDADLTGKRS